MHFVRTAGQRGRDAPRPAARPVHVDAMHSRTVRDTIGAAGRRAIWRAGGCDRAVVSSVGMAVAGRWTIEQVAAVAPSPSSLGAAESIAVAQRWLDLGCDERSVWGRCSGSGAEPYETAVDHVDVAWRCSCPSRKLPCKHALALLVMWVRGVVPEAAPPPAVARWIRARAGRADRPSAKPVAETDQPDHQAPDTTPGTETEAGVGTGDDPEPSDRPEPVPPIDGDRSRDERVARMREGLVELDRWLEDRIRTGLADPSLARYATWDDLAARLVDARAGALANRIRRLAGLVGTDPDWHARVLAEIGVLHLLAQAGQRLPDLPGGLADSVATATGWQVRQADVLAGVPDTDRWIVAGRSDTREDRIEVRRTWLRGASRAAGGRWCCRSPPTARASTRRSPSAHPCTPTCIATRALPSARSWASDSEIRSRSPCRRPRRSSRRATRSVARSRSNRGSSDIPRPCCAAPTRHGGRWVLTDDTGSLPLVATRTRAGHGARRDRGRTHDAHRRVDTARRDPAHRARRRSGARRRAGRRSVVRRGRMTLRSPATRPASRSSAGASSLASVPWWTSDHRRSTLLVGPGDRGAARHRPARPTGGAGRRAGRPHRRHAPRGAVATNARRGVGRCGGAAGGLRRRPAVRPARPARTRSVDRRVPRRPRRPGSTSWPNGRCSRTSGC